MNKYQVTLTGTTPLLMHADDLDWADKLKAYRNSVEGKKDGVSGDDRSPAWSWIGYLYNDGKHIVMQSENIMRALMEAGALVIANKQKTFKSQTQSGIMSGASFWKFMVNGAPISLEKITPLINVKDFEEHKKSAIDNGFILFVKRAKIGTQKHVRVRPRFDHWSVEGELIVTDDQITKQILENILKLAGQYKGLCDWRPGSKTPGPFGMFSVAVE